MEKSEKHREELFVFGAVHLPNTHWPVWGKAVFVVFFRNENAALPVCLHLFGNTACPACNAKGTTTQAGTSDRAYRSDQVCRIQPGWEKSIEPGL